MERLDFTLPDFTRVAWVSDPARAVWEPRVQRIAAAWRSIEWQSVAQGVRRCAIATEPLARFIDDAARWAAHGLAAVPLELVGETGQPYVATSSPVVPGHPVMVRLVLGAPSDAAAFHAAWEEADDEAIGAFLGYPACCRKFFTRTWVDDQMVDTTWPMALNTVYVTPDASDVDVDGPPQSNILWRWMGVRAIPHLPCGFACPATVEVANGLVQVGRNSGFEAEMKWLLEILSWPVEWSALHGIAEIKTPVLRVSTRTDATATKHVVRRRGDRYPLEGAQGLRTPYDVPVRLRLRATPGYQRGIRHSDTKTAELNGRLATDNGFATVESMLDAHAPIIDAVVDHAGSNHARIIDLGCGNGALLAAICAASKNVVPYGIDIDSDTIDHARRVHPLHAANFVVGDLFDAPAIWRRTRFDIALLMPGRLLEVPESRADQLRRWLAVDIQDLFVYAYEDWTLENDELSSLCVRAGLTKIKTVGPTIAVARALIPVRSTFQSERS